MEPLCPRRHRSLCRWSAAHSGAPHCSLTRDRQSNAATTNDGAEQAEVEIEATTLTNAFTARQIRSLLSTASLLAMSSLNAALAGVSQQLDSQRSNRNNHAADSTVAPPRKAAVPAPSADSDDDTSDAGGGGADDDSPILVFCRIRPPLRGTAAGKSMLAVDAESKKVEFNLSRAHADSAHNTVNNSRDQFKFSFNGLFPEDTTQAQMFEGVAIRVLENVTSGYNGQRRRAESL